MTVKISVCIITLNEEDNISRCLESLIFANEIIIVDSGSTDKTLKLARNFPKVKIVKRKFDNYISQKNFALHKATGDWILSLDADETISEELAREILTAITPDSDFNGFYIPRQTEYLGKWIKHSGWFPNYQLRLVKKDKGKFRGNLVHERMEIKGKTGYLKSALRHYSYKNISDHINFINRYTELAAKEKYNSGKCSSLTWAFLEGGWKFFSMYIIRFGFLDGKAGLVLATLGFYYNFLKYLKLFEMCRKKN